jgi:hypothetical protein
VVLKTSGALEWRTLLTAEMVHEAIMSPAEALNPTAAEKVCELSEIRAIEVTTVGLALAGVLRQAQV